MTTVYIRFDVYLRVHLEKEVARRGYDLQALTLHSRVLPSDIVILTDVSSFRTIAGYLQLRRIHRQGTKIVLCLLEPSLVLPYNYIRILHREATYVYTWDDELVDQRYKKLLWPQDDEGRYTVPVPFKRKKLLAIFAANKKPALPLSRRSLYGKRISAMRFFEKKIPEQFDIFGRGWDKPSTLNERIFGVRGYRTWKGFAKDKIGHLKQYRFCICYENMQGKYGYITEKIWDSFKARCVPIYWGAVNVDEYIPKGTYIDRRAFKSDQEVLDFITSMTESEYNKYIVRIEKFIRAKKTDRWFSDAFAKMMLSR